ncbi:unnamed protein product [Trifolium pratense]|uniref:Uncharacterized protein n=1 Tax=Trifolium pratense TaxID=57577 RepID=A0ACB0LDX8_TRIPR|nr:unnamed protein product [Trifolium pratense]
MNLFTTNNPSFPAGLRVLAVDHDTYDFYTIHHICNQLHYQVTLCSTISQAKQLLSTSHFDIILVETHIPQQDTYAFVQQVTSHLKIPVIMMSLDNRTCSVMDSISNGACSYWAKPLDENLFKNMWQHVVRQHLVQKESEAKGLKKRGREHLVQKESEAKGLKKRGRDDEVHVSKQPPAKKARFSWTDDLHQKFVSVVNHLGIKNAKPKKVLKIMDCPGLELQHVASHLQWNIKSWLFFAIRYSMAMEVTQALLNAQSIDGTVRKHAEESLRQFQEQNLPGFLVSLSGELASEDKPVDSRKLAGLILKNALDAKDENRKRELVQRWLSLDSAAKAQVKACLLQTLSSLVLEARSTATQVVAKIAGIELPQKQWPELIGSLLSNIHQIPAHVKQATLETLGYLCEEVSHEVVDQDQVNKILTAVVQGMNSSEKNNDVRLAATRALYNALGFAQANFSNDMEREYIMRVVCETTMSPEEIVQSLLTVTQREDATESRLRTAAYETLNEVVRCSTDETAPLVLQLVAVIMMELHKCLEAQNLSYGEREKQSELTGLLCGCLQVIIQKLGSSEPTKYVFLHYADHIMGLFIRVFARRNATAHEEAMLAIGALAYAIGPDFAKYLPEFYQFLEANLQNFEDYQVCAVTVGVVGDICRALEDKILPYCDGIMTQLLKNLSSDNLHRSVKPPLFSCIGDIALAIGDNFNKYLTYAMNTLQIAAEMYAHTSGFDMEMTEYINNLRNGILEAYSGIFQGFKNSSKTQFLIPYASHILHFLDIIYMEKDMDDVVMKTAIGVLGDLAYTLGSNAGLLTNYAPNLLDTRGRLLPRSYDVLGLYTTFIFQKPDPDITPPIATPIMQDTSYNLDEVINDYYELFYLDVVLLL